MILPPLRYLRPGSVAEAVTMLAENDGATVLAGGQTLTNALKLDLVAPTALVDIHRLDELRNVSVSADDTLSIGAATTYAALAASPEVRDVVPSIAVMADGLVDRQVRNRGTIGGNVCLNDPTNNFPPLLRALDASFRILGPDGLRTVAADNFFAGTLTTTLRPGELLTAIDVRRLPSSSRLVHRHLQLGADSWAMARAVVRLDMADGVAADARIMLGAVLGSPHRLPRVEEALNGRLADAELVEAAAAAFDAEVIDTVGDVHCSAEYRRQMAKVQLRRALRDVVEGERS